MFSGDLVYPLSRKVISDTGHL